MYFLYVENDFNKYYNTIKNSKLKDIIEYSLEGGKCVRSFIIKHLIETLSDKSINIWEPIVSIELIHGASLILDDLPCMDNDKIRRKKPSTFVKFGERQAILTSIYAISEGFKLLLNGFEKLTNLNIEFYNQDKNKLQLIKNLINEWSNLIGDNLVVGQMLDLKENVEKLINRKLELPCNNVKQMIVYKTCSIFIFSFLLGGLFSGKDINIQEYKDMGYHFGIMFQLMDDYRDQYTDEKDANYILTNGILKSKQIYLDSKKEFYQLLEKNNICTQELIQLVNIIDKKFNL